MIVYLDANVVIYLVEAHPIWGPKARIRISRFEAAGDQIAVGDASRLECLVGPYVLGDPQMKANYTAFFQSPGVTVFPLTAAVCERAALIRATFRIQALDSLHLATASEHGCGLFLTKDDKLRKCTQISVEILT